MIEKAKLNFATERLPLNFIILGYALMAIGIWRVFVVDWRGVLFLIFSVFLVFLKSGVIIDVARKLFKKYFGIFFIKSGKWESLSQLIGLLVVKTRETLAMSVLSISRTETSDLFKLYLSLPDRQVELFSGDEEVVLQKAEKLATSLLTTLVVHTEL